MIQVFNDINSYRNWRKNLHSGLSLGFVPTMGALHQGHASLMEASVAQNDLSVLSIFVNPTQFAPGEDLDKYPRTLEADIALAESLGVDAVFAPIANEVYPAEPSQINFNIRDLDKVMEGETRPTHMNGVVQVVSILFHIIQPQRAYFGLKDFQQQLIIKTLVKELHFPIEIIACPIIREDDGLAMSSRNRYLSQEERKDALYLYQSLCYIKDHPEQFDSVDKALAFVKENITNYPLVKLDYIQIRNAETLALVDSLDAANKPHAFMAAYLGKTRLIDNMRLS
ncbi:MAG: pantoate--beta-alanine ligase [Bacteroidia bacterium]|nr:pantoate--beta-alanine ligase [Bacteroidia bacterium]